MKTKGIKGESETPWLMISHGKLLKKHLIYNPSEKRFRMLNNIPELNGKKVLGSIYGWLVLVVPDHRYGDCCLFDPKTKEKIELPKLNDSRSYNQCILTKPPTEPDCYILFNGLEQSFCRIGDKEYVTIEEEEEDDHVAIVSFQGKIYGFMGPDKFVTIHFVENAIEFRQIPMVEPWVIPHSSGKYDIWLIESSQSCGGELLLVQKIYVVGVGCYDGLDFKVFRIDTNRMKCIEVDNIGNRTIFLSLSGDGYCCPSSMGIKPNSIYYTNEYGYNRDIDLDRNLHVFDLEHRTISSILPSRAVAAKKLITTSWVQCEIFDIP